MSTSRKRQKRENAAAEELELLTQKSRELDALAKIDDSNLFVIDRSGSKTARVKQQKAVEAAKKGGTPSVIEQKLIRKLIVRNQQKESAVVSSKPVDLWSTEDNGGSNKLKGVNKSRVKKENKLIIRGGQSYNPSKEDHQNILAEVCNLSIQSCNGYRFSFYLFTNNL